MIIDGKKKIKREECKIKERRKRGGKEKMTKQKYT